MHYSLLNWCKMCMHFGLLCVTGYFVDQYIDIILYLRSSNQRNTNYHQLKIVKPYHMLLYKHEVDEAWLFVITTLYRIQQMLTENDNYLMHLEDGNFKWCLNSNYWIHLQKHWQIMYNWAPIKLPNGNTLWTARRTTKCKYNDPVQVKLPNGNTLWTARRTTKCKYNDPVQVLYI